MIGTAKRKPETVGYIAFVDVSNVLSEVVDFDAIKGTSIDKAVIEHQLVKAVDNNCNDPSIIPFLVQQAREFGRSYLLGCGYHQRNDCYIKG